MWYISLQSWSFLVILLYDSVDTRETLRPEKVASLGFHLAAAVGDVFLSSWWTYQVHSWFSSFIFAIHMSPVCSISRYLPDGTHWNLNFLLDTLSFILRHRITAKVLVTHVLVSTDGAGIGIMTVKLASSSIVESFKSPGPWPFFVRDFPRICKITGHSNSQVLPFTPCEFPP